MNKYKSKFEVTTASYLTKHKIRFVYEYKRHDVFITKTISWISCPYCDAHNLIVKKTYLPDFFLGTTKLTKKEVYLETKGRFTAKDREKILAFVKQYHIIYYILFQRNNKLSKKSNTYYSDWCEKNKINYAIGALPKQWLKEFRQYEKPSLPN